MGCQTADGHVSLAARDIGSRLWLFREVVSKYAEGIGGKTSQFIRQAAIAKTHPVGEPHVFICANLLTKIDYFIG